MLTRIRNAASMHKPQVVLPCSKMKTGVARVLKEEGYVNGYDVIEDTKQSLLRIDLKYGQRGEDVIHEIRRVSKPGCRVYRGVGDLPKVLNGLGIVIVSTPMGILSDRQCREKRVGGEVLCTIY
jgi:small subunit ribosomal protein S8